MGSVNAMLATSATTVIVPPRRLPAFQMMDRCAVGEAAAFVAAVSVPSRVHLETPVKNAPPALMPVELKGKVSNNNVLHLLANITAVTARSLIAL